MVRGVLFDLDGVLVDSLVSIGNCFNHALQAVGRPPRPLSELRALIGPPIEESVATLLGTDDPQEVTRFMEHYRERYEATAVQETRPAEGLAEVLAALSADHALAVATSKREVYARPILDALGVAEYFGGPGAPWIFGRSLAPGETKATVIGRAVAVAFGGRAEGLVMVGDRRFDVHGAAAHGIPTIGVLHGMGTEEELRAAGARWLVADLRGVPGLIRAIERGMD
ncbi:MAG TPA: HAD hydrolase-like protein [Nannocystis sp.]